MERSRQRAWVAWNPLDRTYSGYVASLAENGSEVSKIADAPDGLAFEEIIGWATETAAEVFVRPHWDSDKTYWVGGGAHDAHPLLEQSRAGEAADVVAEKPITVSGVIANCGDCDWQGTFANQAELLGAFAAHARDHHGGPAHA